MMMKITMIAGGGEEEDGEMQRLCQPLVTISYDDL